MVSILIRSKSGFAFKLEVINTSKGVLASDE
jgi:hypothetical protein